MIKSNIFKSLNFVFLLLLYTGIIFAQNTTIRDLYKVKDVKIVKNDIYTYKAIDICDKKFNYPKDTISYYIGLRTPVLPSDTSMLFRGSYTLCSYSWNRIFDRYTNQEKIEILEELLKYENDTDLSGKKVRRYGFVDANTPKPVSISYTMQIEALYMITLFTTGTSFLSYSPYPVLVNTKTNKEINNNQKEIKKVFKIYKKWVEENKKNGFVNFTLPLNGTKYKWYEGINYRPNFKIENLTQPNMTIGIAKD